MNELDTQKNVIERKCMEDYVIKKDYIMKITYGHNLRASISIC